MGAAALNLPGVTPLDAIKNLKAGNIINESLSNITNTGDA